MAIGQPRTRLLHMLSISCSNSVETGGNEETFTAETASTIPVRNAGLSSFVVLALSRALHVSIKR